MADEPQKFGQYLLLDRIGVGGMAEVFRGRTSGVEGFERLVALKRILPSVAEDGDFVEMFIAEAKLAVQLQHANIAQVYDLGCTDGRYYIAMEYVSGVDLRTMWDRARKRQRLLPIAMSCHIVEKCCEGLDAAHRKKDADGHDLHLVHRDVSPQNTLISFDGEVKVIDFGIAKVATRVSKTQAGTLKGKYGYMSPEQVRGLELDNRSDIFACGIMLYELLVGKRLFLADSDFTTLERVRNAEVVPPRDINKDLSPELERIVMKALAKNRDERYRFASEFADELRHYLYSEGQSIGRTDLHRYMHAHFADELAAEKQRIHRVQALEADAPKKDEAAHAVVTVTRAPYDDGATEPGVSKSQEEPIAVPVVIGRHHTPGPGVGGMAAVDAREAEAAMAPETVASLPLPKASRSVELPVARSRVPASTLAMLGWLLAGVLAGVIGLRAFERTDPGSVTVTVEPQIAAIEVLLNDRVVGNRSPVVLEGLAPNMYVLTVRAPGFVDVIRPLTVKEGMAHDETIRLVPRSVEER